MRKSLFLSASLKRCKRWKSVSEREERGNDHNPSKYRVYKLGRMFDGWIARIANKRVTGDGGRARGEGLSASSAIFTSSIALS